MARSLFSSLVFALCILVLNSGIAHALVEGCNPKVMKAMQDVSQGRVAQAVANDEAIFGKPDNPLAVSCFNQQAGSSAAKASFSGDFTAQLAPVIQEALTNFYDDYDDAPGNDSGVVDYAATALAPNYNCNGADNLWKNFKGTGIKQGVPVALFSDLVGGTLPTGGTLDPDFIKAWNAAKTAQGLFAAIGGSVAALPQIPAIPAPPPPNANVCQTLVAFGITPGPCP